MGTEFSRRVRRRMIARLVLVASVISVVAGVAGWRYERAQLESTIADLVIEQAFFFDIPTRAGAVDWRDVDAEDERLAVVAVLLPGLHDSRVDVRGVHEAAELALDELSRCGGGDDEP